ncbi:Uncharacterised protein [Salmonella enterica subsp. arizonae]|uniref:Uncharacterized protein n=1 Tax=Salmonella enterica subsp. arizonae TaxID=59203 RepID=A0A379SSA8_SALER|nr:Uncharacterised protein [Salmonella enterica subsp. arizonae]
MQKELRIVIALAGNGADRPGDNRQRAVDGAPASGEIPAARTAGRKTASKAGCRLMPGYRASPPTAPVAHSQSPIADPSVKSQNISVTSAPRRRAGKYSDVMVMVFGIAPPSPKPVKKRNSTRISISGEKAESRLNAPNSATQSSITRLRPKRSASGPHSSAPAVSSSNPAPNSGMSSLALSCQWVRVSGAMKPIAAVSKPVEHDHQKTADDNATLHFADGRGINKGL